MNPWERDLFDCLRLGGIDPACAGSVRRIPGEASTRLFFRLELCGAPRVAMIYPQAAAEDIDRIVRLTGVYLEHGVRVPRIEARLGERGLLLEDVGLDLFQTRFRRAGAAEKRALLAVVAELLERLRAIDPRHTPTALDRVRVEYEMGFFAAHFAAPLVGEPVARELRHALLELLAAMPAPTVFAHRDFHSRNLVLSGTRISVVDFQDSLRAPPLYDLASIAYDAYLDPGPGGSWLLERLRAQGMVIEREELALTALERNVKALGTFGFQVRGRGHRMYVRYVPRTIRHVRRHLACLVPDHSIVDFFGRDWAI